jgi:hypothetical protein
MIMTVAQRIGLVCLSLGRQHNGAMWPGATAVEHSDHLVEQQPSSIQTTLCLEKVLANIAI